MRSECKINVYCHNAEWNGWGWRKSIKTLAFSDEGRNRKKEKDECVLHVGIICCNTIIPDRVKTFPANYSPGSRVSAYRAIKNSPIPMPAYIYSSPIELRITPATRPKPVTAMPSACINLR